MGYCLGGLCSLDLARHKVGLKVAISFHGTLTPLPDEPRDHIDTTVQVRERQIREKGKSRSTMEMPTT